MGKLVKDGFKLSIYVYVLLLLINLILNILLGIDSTFISGKSSNIFFPWIPDFIVHLIGTIVIVTFWYVIFFVFVGILKNIGRGMDYIAENNFNNKKDKPNKIELDKEVTKSSEKMVIQINKNNTKTKVQILILTLIVVIGISQYESKIDKQIKSSKSKITQCLNDNDYDRGYEEAYEGEHQVYKGTFCYELGARDGDIDADCEHYRLRDDYSNWATLKCNMRPYEPRNWKDRENFNL